MRKITLFLALTFSMLAVAQDRFQKINPIGFETYRVKLLYEIPSE